MAAVLGPSINLAAAAAAPAEMSVAVLGPAPRLAEANGYVFDWPDISGDDTIHVYDLTGRQVTTIPDEADVESFSVNNDGSRLYAGLAASHAVSVVDTASLAEVARYDVSNLGSPGPAVLVGRRLYLSGTNTYGLGIGVIDADATSGSPTVLAGASGYGGFTAYPSSSAGTDDLVTSSCDFGAACSVTSYRYDGTHTTEDVTVNADDFGKLFLDKSDNVLMTETSKGTAVRDPETLAVQRTIGVNLSGVQSGPLNGLLASYATDPATNHAMLQVHDLTGAKTFEAKPSAPDISLVPILQADEDAVYAAEETPDGAYKVISFPYALQPPTGPHAPGDVTATLRPAGQVLIAWRPSLVDANNAPAQYTIYRSTSGVFGAPIGVVSASTTSYDDTSADPGTHYFYEVSAVNDKGDASTELAGTATPDSAPPKAQVTPLSPFTASSAVTVAYRATDAGSGVSTYDVRYRSAAWNGGFGSYAYPPVWQRRTATMAELGLVPGRDYCVSVRARDHAGNVSGWSPDTCTAAPLDDRNLRRATKGWLRRSVAHAYRGTTTSATTRGAELTLSGARAHRLALVAMRCSACGTVALYLNGHYWRSVNLHSTATHPKAIVVLPAFALHDTSIAVRTTGTKLVVIDGLGVSRT